MKLIHSPSSPFVRKVSVTLAETGQSADVTLEGVKTTALSTADAAAAANPLGKIPALVRPDGPALYDSRVICRYLVARAKSDLYPEERLWDVLTLEATADGMLEAAVLMVYEKRLRPENMVFEDWIEAQWGKVAGALDALNERWMSHLFGPLDMGQIAVGCALGYLDFRHGDRNWRQGRDGLAGWYAEFAKRDSMLATVPSD
ncbi:glutathione S-transferase family protein [Shimia sp. R11_0]|uniref:glutathione S-transferase family protein n=1 Tax=Shimia sp. R11_0 TaxID=2821096 RepID=UPI001ADBBABA|nr:glutathione S-transferase family protein [Shimia sp. R11_0]MBO9476350.1 glutathione S-transferase family protein [Shimia sp. R11_0]